MEFRVLGALEVVQSVRSGPPPGAKERAVLARLLVDPGRPVAADALLDAGWPDSPRDQAARSLGVRIANLRSFLEPDRAPGAPATVLLRVGPGYRLAIDPEQVDSQRARRLVSEAGERSPVDALALLDEALELWRGAPFADFTYADFAQGEIAALDELRRQAVERRAAALVELGRAEDAVPELRRLLGGDPLREVAVRTLMTALYRAGRQVEALDTYRALCGELVALGLQPSAETRELEGQVLNQDEALRATAAAVAAVGVATPPVAAPPAALLGRERELARLHAAYVAATRGARQMVAFSGEPGVGKSAVVDAFRESIVGSESLVAAGQSIEHRGVGEPFMPILEGLASMAAGPAAEMVVATLAERAPTWLAEMPWLLDAEGFEALEYRTRGATRQRMLREIAEALDALTRQRPLVLILEDLHWADDSTLDLVHALARRGAAARLLVIVTFRTARPSGGPEAQRLVHELSVRGACEHVALARLDAEDVARYLAGRVPEGVAGELGPVLAARSGGNPLFMRHLVDHWVDRGAVDADRGLPETLRAYVESQLDWLAADDAELLGAASVAGGRFSVDVLAGALDREPGAIAARCATLARTTRLIERRADGYAFAHGLDREVLYELVPEERRAALHSRIGELLEARYGARAPELAAELAHHFVQGRDPARAVKFLALAAGRSLSRSAYAEGVRQLRAALAAAGGLEAGIERTRWEVELLSQLAHALVATEGWGSAGAEAALTDARGRAELLTDREPLAAVLYALATMYEVRGDVERSSALSTEYLREGSDADERRIEAQELLACKLFHQGAFAGALERGDHGVALAGSEGSNQSLFAALPGEDMGVTCQMWAGLSLWYLGRPDAALSRAREAERLASAPARDYSRATASAQLALVHQFRLEPEAALAAAEATIALADERGYVYRSAMGRVLRGWALTQLGSPEAGVEEAARGLAMSRMTGARLDDPYYLGLLADGYLRAGELDAARAALDEGLERSARDGAPFYEPELRRLLALVLLQRGELTEAEATLRAAVSCARSQSSRSLELRAATTLAKLLRDAGRAGEARATVAAVYAAFDEGHDTPDLRAAAAVLSRPEGRLD
jgi:DNA-binding SARP family transcriptional activator